ncbi:hypothetical protein [Streptomyces sp. IBSBF 2435]
MHLGIAVLMGLPLFSAAMIVADAAFLPAGAGPYPTGRPTA